MPSDSTDLAGLLPGHRAQLVLDNDDVLSAPLESRAECTCRTGGRMSRHPAYRMRTQGEQPPLRKGAGG
jgi:hypothetical protein